MLGDHQTMPGRNGKAVTNPQRVGVLPQDSAGKAQKGHGFSVIAITQPNVGTTLDSQWVPDEPGLPGCP